MKKLIRRGGDYLRDADGNPMIFTQRQAEAYANSAAARLSKQINCQVTLKGVRDCGDYWTYTIG